MTKFVVTYQFVVEKGWSVQGRHAPDEEQALEKLEKKIIWLGVILW
jgi:hypothetical protein